MQASETHVHCMLLKTGIALFEYSEYVVYDAVLNADFKTQELSKISLLCITLYLYFFDYLLHINMAQVLSTISRDTSINKFYLHRCVYVSTLCIQL